jgi:DNA invertase Pin-like site-specific DNA recombinase
MKVAIYARVSTDEQSVDKQIQECTEFCNRKGYIISGTYSDVISGAKDSRPQLDLLMKDAFLGMFEGIVVWKLDRLGRSLAHLISIINQLKQHKIAFISITEQMDTTTPQGTFFFNLFGSFAQFERDIISERTKMGLRHAKNVGKRGKDKGRRKRGGYILRYMKQRGEE